MENLGKRRDASERVPHLMGHPGGEQTGRCQPLRAHDLLVQAAQGGDVLHDGEDAGNFACCAAQYRWPRCLRPGVRPRPWQARSRSSAPGRPG